ncbi:hypothetical protein DV736_g2864, partial [Chaetothyriales sp. CBS 134916]
MTQWTELIQRDHKSSKMDDDHARDRPLSVAYLGPPASFSHQAALAVLPSANLTPLPSFSSIFEGLLRPAKGDVGDLGGAPLIDFAVLPIENSTNGSVVQALDLLAKCSEGDPYADIQVCEEHYLPVHHFIYTNANNTNSCSKYLAQHFPHAERIDVSSTSTAALLVAKDESGGSAAICSRLAGKSWKLKCLGEQIEDEPGTNTTRFFVLRNRTRPRGEDSLPSRRRVALRPPPPSPPTGRGDEVNAKALVLFTINHVVPGSLSTALQVFAKHGLNLTRIDTRPSRQCSWHYVFFVECKERVKDIDNSKDTKLQGASEELQGLTESVTCLGRWIDMLQFEE